MDFLKKLREAHVPVLWRLYHGMNGSWFWWEGRLGEYSTKALYIQLFDRYVHHHKLNNLVWLWSVDRPNKPEMAFSNYYPGNAFLDVVSLDVYGGDFSQMYYDSLMALSKGKPLVLAEVGTSPPPEVLDSQPNWGLYAIWAGMVRNTMKKQYQVLIDDPRITTARRDKNSILVESIVTFNQGGRSSEMKTTEVWNLQDDGRVLSIQQNTQSFRGPREVTLIYDLQ